MKLLVCGGMGFIGSTFIRNHQDKNPNDHITNVDSLTTGSNIKNLEKNRQNRISVCRSEYNRFKSRK